MKNARINFRGENKAETTETATYSQSEVASLVERASNGNFEAFGKLYHIYVGRIYQYVFYQVRDKMIAEDITADVFMKALDAIKTCRGRETTFSSWLYRIAHNRTMDSFRSARRNLPIEIETMSNVGDPKQELGKNLEKQEILQLVAELPQNQRQVIIMKFIEGLDNNEIGQIMGKSQVAVRLLQFRALSALRARLGSGQ